MDVKEEIRNRVDIADFIGEYLELKKAGAGSFKAVCPFHAEKTPSFHVSKEKQIWHCFGCGEGGDVFAFLMRMEGIEFPEALRLLGKRAGVEIPRFSSTESNERSRVVEVNTMARAFYAKVLETSTLALEAREYVAKRAIPQELVQDFGLGYAPDRWDGLVVALRKRDFSDQELLAAGLAQRGRMGLIDRFRNRLMIPLEDAHGNTVGFTARVLPSATADAGPKYLNSPETAAYHKGEILFGLSKAKQDIKREHTVIIVEGNLDVIASHKAGVKHVVASSGTALTQAQIQLLKRYTTRLIFCFDQDAAGFAAALRGIHLATELGCDVEVLLIPREAGKDPDEVVQKDPELWRRIVSVPVPIMPYYFEHATRGKNLQDVVVKREVGHFLLGEIGRLSDAIEREHWLQKLSDLLRTDISVLRSLLIQKPSSPASVTEHPVPLPPKTPQSRAEKAFEQILGVFVQFPRQRATIAATLAPSESYGPLNELYRILLEAYNSGKFETWSAAPTPEHLARRLIAVGEEVAERVESEHLEPYVKEHLQVVLDGCARFAKKELLAELRQAEARGDAEAVSRILTQFSS
ncbi:DNA primase [Candidatus Uhrbacteria bacterium]|nr:DNA primase [Candidatus Uhrbacteria bacterium]